MVVKIITYLIVALFVLLWGYTALPKFKRLKWFSAILKRQALPRWAIPTLTWLVPTSEVFVIILLLVPQTRLIGLYASFFLMLIFSIYVAGILYGAYERHPCGCGAMFRRMGWRTHFWVNVLLTSLALLGALLMVNYSI